LIGAECHGNTNINTNTKVRRRSARSIASLVTAVLLLSCALMSALPAGPASAASTTVGDFSSMVVPNPDKTWIGDCYVEVGPTFDGFGAWRKVGGVRINCGSAYSWIEATVWTAYWNPQTQRSTMVGQLGYGVRYNTTGSGQGINGILRGGYACGGQNYYWRTEARVRTSRGTDVIVLSSWKLAPLGQGC
jgi:hypothetical protein